MIYCPDCGYPNDPSEHRCERCGIRFELLSGEARPEPLPQRTPAAYHPPPAWRGEVRQRVNRFRERHGLQAALPLDYSSPAPSRLEALPAGGKLILFPGPQAEPVESRPGSPALGPESRPGSAFERVPQQPAEAAVQPRRNQVRKTAQAKLEEQRQLNFPPALETHAEPFLEFPVAPLMARFLSGAADGVMVAIGCGLLFIAYHLAGGKLPLLGGGPSHFTRVALLATLAALATLPLFYHFLFLMFTARTPGMHWTGLRLVDFDGRPASRSRRLKRAVASVASGGSFFLGFLWAALDEEQLTWHDRMSETYLTVSASGQLRTKS